MAETSKRRKLYEDIQMLIAGHDVGTGLSAVCDSLASLIAFAARDRDHAREMCSALPADIDAVVSNNWDYVRSIRAGSQEFSQAGN